MRGPSSLLTVADNSKALLDWGSSIALEMELGRLAVEQDSLDTAVSHFDAAAAEASNAGYPNLEVKARTNALRARMDNQDLPKPRCPSCSPTSRSCATSLPASCRGMAC